MRPHHAIMFEGSADTALPHVHRFIAQNIRIPIKKNPDVVHIQEARFTVTHARELKARASQTPLGVAQVFVLITDTILHEAQNTLLKLLEEPTQHTYFILILPNAMRLLPTVRSRLSYAGKIDTYISDNDIALAKTFLAGSPVERARILSPIIKEKDAQAATTFLNALETYAHRTGAQQNAQVLNDIALVRSYISDPSASLKMLLEYLTVTNHTHQTS